MILHDFSLVIGRANREVALGLADVLDPPWRGVRTGFLSVRYITGRGTRFWVCEQFCTPDLVDVLSQQMDHGFVLAKRWGHFLTAEQAVEKATPIWEDVWGERIARAAKWAMLDENTRRSL